jgi:hypothetical protein
MFRVRRHLSGGFLIAVHIRRRQEMNAISKTAAGALVIASLLGGGVAVASAGAPAAAVHPAPQAATAIEYALIAY